MSVVLWQRPRWPPYEILGCLHSWLHIALHCVARLLTTAFTGLLWKPIALNRGLELWRQAPDLNSEPLTWLVGVEYLGLYTGTGNASLLLGPETRYIEWILLCAGHLLMTARSSHCGNTLPAWAHIFLGQILVAHGVQRFLQNQIVVHVRPKLEVVMVPGHWSVPLGLTCTGWASRGAVPSYCSWEEQA
jgi:hypothetical protein